MDFSKEDTQGFKDVIDYMADVSIKKSKSPKFISAIIKEVYLDGTCDVYLPPDMTTAVTGLVNKSGEYLSVGDSVELCTKNGKVNNAWISIKHGKPGNGVAFGVIKRNSPAWWIGGRDASVVMQTAQNTGSWNPVADVKTYSGDWSIGTLGNTESLYFNYVTDTNYNSSTNSSQWLRINVDDNYYCTFDTSKAEFKFTKRTVATDFYSLGGFITENGGIQMTNNGVVTTIRSENSSYCHYNTNAPSGHWFNTTVRVQGDVYGGSSYNRRLAYYDEVSNAINYTYDTGWVNITTIYGGSWEWAQIRRIGKVVHLRAKAYENGFSHPNSYINVFGIDSQFVPSKQGYAWGFTTGRKITRWVIKNDGYIGMDWAANMNDGSYYTGSAWTEVDTTWMVD